MCGECRSGINSQWCSRGYCILLVCKSGTHYYSSRIKQYNTYITGISNLVPSTTPFYVTQVVGGVNACVSPATPVTLTINPNPAAITGTVIVCAGSTTTLADATAGGTWSSASTGVATISALGVVTGVSGGTSVISYTLGTGCFATTTVTVNAMPQGSLTANGPFCVTGTGQLKWTATAGSGTYTVVYNDGVADRTIAGVTSGTPFNVNTNPVVSNTTYTLKSVTDANCVRSSGFTGGSATITVNPLPAPVITGSATVCNGTTGSVYSTPNVVGHTYVWAVTKGTITAGAGTNSITVTWTTAGSRHSRCHRDNNSNRVFGSSDTESSYGQSIAGTSNNRISNSM